MKWFKFYGQDWLTDLKILKMSVEDRLCFITLLCLASSEENKGTIKNYDEESVISLTHLYNDPLNDENEYTRAKGFTKRLIDNKMITLDNKGALSLVNFLKRQGQNLTGYERVKRYRERNKTLKIKDNSHVKNVINDNIRDNANDNVRIDKKRVDKNIHTTLPTPSKEGEGKEINEIIESFRTVNPSIGKHFGRIPQRDAVSRMLKVYGKEKLMEIISALPEINAKPYWKKSFTPCELEDNIPFYIASFKSDKLKVKENNKVAFL